MEVVCGGRTRARRSNRASRALLVRALNGEPEPNARPPCNLPVAVKRTSRRDSRSDVGPVRFTRQFGFEDSLEYVAAVAIENRTTLEHAQNN